LRRGKVNGIGARVKGKVLAAAERWSQWPGARSRGRASAPISRLPWGAGPRAFPGELLTGRQHEAGRTWVLSMLAERFGKPE